VPQRKRTITHEVTDTDEVVIYDGTGPQLLVLNEVAAGVWLLVDGQRSVDEITEEIVTHMNAERETVARDVLAFLGQLEQRELITWKEPT
jgi:hypothetical protein